MVSDHMIYNFHTSTWVNVLTPIYEIVLSMSASLPVTEAMYANAILEALHTSCDQARRAGDGRTIIHI